MLEPVNLADPECEPTDEQLRELMAGAFAGVREQRERALQRIRAEIEAARAVVLQEVEAATASTSAAT
jgi:hypothetical protein